VPSISLLQLLPALHDPTVKARVFEISCPSCLIDAYPQKNPSRPQVRTLPCRSSSSVTFRFVRNLPAPPCQNHFRFPLWPLRPPALLLQCLFRSLSCRTRIIPPPFLSLDPIPRTSNDKARQATIFKPSAPPLHTTQGAPAWERLELSEWSSLQSSQSITTFSPVFHNPGSCLGVAWHSIFDRVLAETVEVRPYGPSARHGHPRASLGRRACSFRGISHRPPCAAKGSPLPYCNIKHFVLTSQSTTGASSSATVPSVRLACSSATLPTSSLRNTSRQSSTTMPSR
jgi:hypothetical protein